MRVSPDSSVKPNSSGTDVASVAEYTKYFHVDAVSVSVIDSPISAALTVDAFSVPSKVPIEFLEHHVVQVMLLMKRHSGSGGTFIQSLRCWIGCDL